MSNVKIINLTDVSIYLMEASVNLIDTYLKTLNPSEKNRLKAIKHPEKKLEYAASRYLKHQLFGSEELFYDDSGSPYLERSGFISISHSKKYVAIGTCDSFEIGIDIEEINQKALLVQHKFVNEKEKSIFNIHSAKEMTLLWSFKETLYKLSDRNQLIFKTDLQVTKTKSKYLGKTLTTKGFKETILEFIEFDGFLITCNQTKLQLLHEHS